MIKLLDKTTIDQIAAGEVIERPSSVVKELLENSIDAGATAVTVEIREGGLSFIRVTDNGCGIPKDEVKTAYLRHATSKIENASDLAHVASLGFRGEALSTIAAVSQTEMITKTPESLIGVKYTVHGGEEIDFQEVGVPDGTTIVVRNLFYNTPARKKFLKSPMTEGYYISDLILKLALSHPDISFKLIVNGQSKVDTSGNGNTKDTIYQLFGRDITSNLIELSHESETIKISGYIGKPFICRGNRGLENYFINNRYIKSNVVNRAIEEGYKTFVMQHKFPFTVLYLTLPQEKCDVNIHPTKMEFKYENERELFETVTKTVREALLEKDLIPKEEYNRPDAQKNASQPKKDQEKPAEPYETNRIGTGRQPMSLRPNTRAGNYSSTYKILETLKKAEEEENTNLLREDPGVTYTRSVPEYSSNPKIAAYQKTEETGKKIKSGEMSGIAKEEQLSLFEDSFLSEKARSRHRLIGQLFDTYWLIEYNDQLYIMDQHAAHEKVKYEELMANFKKTEVLSQQLMPPMVITVSYAERQAILEHYDLFMKIGYDIEEFGGNEFKINAIPSNLYGLHGREMFMDFVSSLIENSGYVSNDIFIKKLSTMACKAAIKGNTEISFQEADSLIGQLLLLENPYTCPHGRPTIISMSKAELEKKFKRVL